MLTMYKIFTDNPSQNSLDAIINNAKKIVSNAPTDLKGTGFNASIAQSFSQHWLRTFYEPTQTYKKTINNNFNDILLDIDSISKHTISDEARAIYLNVIQEYAAKIKQVYNL
jgi:hypothetical protein